MHEFHQVLPQLLRRGGRYSFFNGICTENIFFQGVACQVCLQGLARVRPER
jgi:protein arginine N-methyltransferase 2